MVRGRVLYFPRRKSMVIAAGVLMFLLCLSLIITSQANERPVMSYAVANKIIAIDPGHGGTDSGAVRDSIIEKDITLSISKKLAKELSQAGAAVIMIRDNDADMIKEGQKFNKREDLSLRVQKANENKADLYISIHTNADPNPRWFGAQTFYCPTSEESKLLAESIQEELTRILGNTTRKALVGDYFVMKNTAMPAVIVEVGFISNKREGQLLTNDEYQNKVAYAIFSGIAKSQDGI